MMLQTTAVNLGFTDLHHVSMLTDTLAVCPLELGLIKFQEPQGGFAQNKASLHGPEPLTSVQKAWTSPSSAILTYSSSHKKGN